MSKYCPECGVENEINAKFCRSCGVNFVHNNTHDDNQISNIKCPHCGREMASGNNKCIYCGKSLDGRQYRKTVIAGYVIFFFIPIISLIIGIFLLTRNEDVKKHGIILIVISLAFQIFSMLISI